MADPHPGGVQCLQVARTESEANQQREQHQLRPEAAAGVRGEQHGHDGQVSCLGDEGAHGCNYTFTGGDLDQAQEDHKASTNSHSDTGN